MSEEPRLLGGRYEVAETIGYGGMAEVHRGRDRRLGREVAIKLLRSDLAHDETFLIRFRREAQNSASLNHPNIVAVFDTGEEDGIPYMVMEYVDGKTLKEYLLADGAFEPARAAELVADSCSALDFSHKHHIIHRDIKPGNIMLTSTGQVKVMDFGIARALASGQSTMTQTSAVIGTAQYLSPEQARGETVDARSDVYATGCVLYELLVGHPPFTGDNPVSVAYQHVKEDPTPPSQVNPAIPPQIDAVVMKALAKNPDNRYQSAGEMREDLMRAAAGGAVTAPMVMPSSDETQIVGGAGVGAPNTETITPIETRKSKKRGPLIALITILALLAIGGGAWLVWALGNGEEGNGSVTVPNVMGQTQEEAEKQLEADNFEVAYERETADTADDEDIGTVTEQDPEGNTQAKEGSTVTITILEAPGKISLDDYRGQQYSEAEEALEDAGFDVEREDDDDSSESPGTVVDQDPPGGREVDRGATITLTVASGANQVEVPNVTGVSEEHAQSRLDDLGLEMEIEYRADNGNPDVSIDQDPPKGTTVEKGTTVTVFFPGVQIEFSNGTTTVAEFMATYGEQLEIECVQQGSGGSCNDTDVVVGSAPPNGDTVAPGTPVTIDARDPDDEDDGGEGGEDDPSTDPSESEDPLDPTG
ncbi:Stk1 family PASTA domain-containing Ser/Thr kinase [Salininema proteolyticum]|uniref:non-specific serine/threonine protein kinase n=1 Tax=Salininema proteolyticum TaxID=1607685 RepID=A0ABV8TWS3_9ACTN